MYDQGPPPWEMKYTGSRLLMRPQFTLARCGHTFAEGTWSEESSDARLLRCWAFARYRLAVRPKRTSTRQRRQNPWYSQWTTSKRHFARAAMSSFGTWAPQAPEMDF